MAIKIDECPTEVPVSGESEPRSLSVQASAEAGRKCPSPAPTRGCGRQQQEDRAKPEGSVGFGRGK